MNSRIHIAFSPGGEDIAAINTLLAATIGEEVWALRQSIESLVRDHLERMSAGERRTLLFALARPHHEFLKKRFGIVTTDRARTLRYAFLQLGENNRHWTPELALEVFRTIRINRGIQNYWRIRDVIRLIERSGIVFARAPETDAEFDGMINLISDGGPSRATRKSLHRIFGRFYVSGLRSAYSPYDDLPFRTFLDKLIHALHRIACERGGPDAPLAHILSGESVFPIDQTWLATAEAKYRHWEDVYGERRWIEALAPGWPADAFPALLEHLASAKTATPSGRWLAKAKGLIEENGRDAICDLLVAQAADFGSAEEVADSEALWADGARAYALLHKLYRQRSKYPDPVDSLVGGSYLFCLPWIGIDGGTREHYPPDNPICCSELNTNHARGVTWMLPLLEEDAMSSVLEDMVTGASANITTIHGPRTRSLAVARAGIWSLSRMATPGAAAALKRLLGMVEEPRILKLLRSAIAC